MSRNQLTSQQRAGQAVILLKELGLESIDHNNAEPESTAMKQAISYAQQKNLPGFVVSFTSRKKSTQLTVVSIEKFKIPVRHPQCVRHIAGGFYAMTSNF